MNKSPADILKKIVAHKQHEVAAAKQAYSQADLELQIAKLPQPRDFVAALENKIKQQKPAIIAEIKKASPSKGIIRHDFDPIAIAKTYEQAGASCLSVLTDKEFFHGDDKYLQQVKAHSSLPILRKDFIIDPYQIYQARSLGADCILLIAAILTARQLQEFTLIAKSLGLAVLPEVHEHIELAPALNIDSLLIGINNRNLRDFSTDIHRTFELLPEIEPEKIVVTESGINSKEDVTLMQQHHVNAFLIGETFMRADDPGEKLKEMFGSW